MEFSGTFEAKTFLELNTERPVEYGNGFLKVTTSSIQVRDFLKKNCTDVKVYPNFVKVFYTHEVYPNNQFKFVKI